MENKKYILIEFLSAIFSILFLILSFLSFGSYNFSHEKIKKYKENWNLTPISNIFEVSSKCPKNSSDFFTNFFPGNFKGCDCFNVKSNTYKKKIFNESCNSNQIENKCKNIKENDNINLNVWKGKKLCVERMEKKYNFFMLNQYKTTKNSCENGFKFCGFFDTKKNFLCLPENLNCPISNVFIDNENVVNNYKTIKLNNDFYLHFSKNEGEKIYLEFLANDKNFCFDDKNGNFGQNNFILNKKKGEIECEKINENVFDFRYEKIDEISKIEFFDENEITNKIKFLSDFNLNSNDSIKLFNVNYFSVENECLKKIDFDEFLNPNLKKNNKILNILCIFCFSYNFYLIGIFAIFLFVDDSNDKKFLFYFIDFLKIFFLLILIIISMIFLNKNNKILKNKNIFINENCAEDATKFAFENAYKNLNNVKNYVKIIIFFCFIDIFIRIFYYVYYSCFYNKNKEKKQ